MLSAGSSSVVLISNEEPEITLNEKLVQVGVATWADESQIYPVLSAHRKHRQSVASTSAPNASAMPIASSAPIKPITSNMATVPVTSSKQQGESVS